MGKCIEKVTEQRSESPVFNSTRDDTFDGGEVTLGEARAPSQPTILSLISRIEVHNPPLPR